jgi:hypothetical protein
MWRFTIRDVLWLTVVVALGIGWWVKHLQLAPLRWKLARTERNLSWLVNSLAEKGLSVEFSDDSMRSVARKPDAVLFWMQKPLPIPTPTSSP